MNTVISVTLSVTCWLEIYDRILQEIYSLFYNTVFYNTIRKSVFFIKTSFYVKCKKRLQMLCKAYQID